MDSEIRSLEKAMERAGFFLYALTSGAHSDHGLETVIWGPKHDQDWFEATWTAYKSASREFYYGPGGLHERYPYDYGATPAVLEERAAAWKAAIDEWGAQNGSTFAGHLELHHGFIEPTVETLYLGDV